MKIISVENYKGGVGKTTTSIHLACGLKLLNKNLRVLLIDLDPQSSIKTYFKIKFDKLTIHEFIFNSPLSDCVYKIPISLSHSLEKFDIDIIPSSAKFSEFESRASTIPGKEFLLKRRLEEERINDLYDVIILDCPPAFSAQSQNAMVASDYIIVPTHCDGFSISAIQFLQKTLEDIKKYLKLEPKILGILPTKYDGRHLVSKDVLGGLRTFFKDTYVFNPIRTNTQFKKCQLNKKTIFEYESGALNGTKDYTAFCVDVAKRIGLTKVTEKVSSKESEATL